MVFELNKESDVPLYTQIERRITELIRVGILKADEKLPATRDLALQLHVHRNTVVQAYQELEVKGFVYSEVGRGTFVSKHAHVAAKGVVAAQNKSGNFSFDGLYAEHWINPEDPSMQAIDTIVRTCSKPQDMIAFSSVVPDKHLFPLVDFQNCSYRAIQKYGVDLLEMGDTQGFRPFVEYLPKFLVRRGLTVQSSDITMVSGIQQGIDLIARILINPGDTVITEEVTYHGARRIFKSLGANIIGIPMDDQGMRMDILETILARQKVKMIYTIPTFQNPTGRTMPLERRKHLLELAYHYEIPIVEDQYANELRMEGEEIVPIAALDDEGIVIALGSFSKILFHGIRLGWVITSNRAFQNKLNYAKRLTDWQNNYLIQGAILEFCEAGHFDRYLKRKMKVVKERRDAMITASRQYFPEEVHFHVPAGGLFEWADLPEGMDEYDVLMEARQRRVLFTPKRFFSVRPDAGGGMRLGFVSQTTEHIHEGIAILGDIIKKKMGSAPWVESDSALASVM